MTAIEWTDRTWNPVTGCTKISEGCRNCYAERMAKRLKAMGHPKYGSGFAVTLHPQTLSHPERWRKPSLVFVNSMSDLFHEDVPKRFVSAVFDTMNRTPRHTYQILTKRPEIALEMAPELDWTPNIWLGVSVEDQRAANERIPILLDIPCRIRWISAEPLLGPIDLQMLGCGPLPVRGRIEEGCWNALRGEWWAAAGNPVYESATVEDELPKLDWVVVGGESGPGARPMHPEWVRQIRNQCASEQTPVFFKQWGAWRKALDVAGCWTNTTRWSRDGRRRLTPFRGTLSTGGEPLFDGRSFATRSVNGEIFIRLGKKRAGRLVDGRTWDEMPAPLSIPGGNF